MKICIIGSTSKLGMETIKSALDKKHSVIAISSISESCLTHENLSYYDYEMNPDQLTQVISYVDVVIVTIGLNDKSSKKNNVLAFIRTIRRVKNKINVKVPFILVTEFGTGNSLKYASILTKFMLLFKYRKLKEYSKTEKLVVNSNMNWTIVRHGRLKDKPINCNLQAVTNLYKGVQIESVPKKKVANFLIEEAEQLKFCNLYVNLTMSEFN